MATANSEMVLNYLKQNYGTDVSKQDIAAALGISVSAVTGTINGLTRRGFCTVTREETVEDVPATDTRKAKVRVVKYHQLTEAGLAYDPVAEAEALAAEKAAKAAERAAAKAAKAEA